MIIRIHLSSSRSGDFDRHWDCKVNDFYSNRSINAVGGKAQNAVDENSSLVTRGRCLEIIARELPDCKSKTCNFNFIFASPPQIFSICLIANYPIDIQFSLGYNLTDNNPWVESSNILICPHKDIVIAGGGSRQSDKSKPSKDFLTYYDA